ncbi:MAG: anti-sigma factor [Bacteroidota bacterium]
MNIQEYISSGILEAYVMGELGAQERAEVEKNLRQYPALQQELAEIEEAQEKLLMETAIQPRHAMKARLFDKIDQQATGARVVNLPADSRLAIWRFAAAASITIALISSYLAYNYWSRWTSTKTDLAILLAQNQRIAQDYNQVNQRLDKIEEDLKVTSDPEFKRVVMMGTEIAKEATAYVYWKESTREVYLSIKNMKQLSRENQYQLWAIIDGKPVDAGVFDGNLAGLVKMKEIGPGVAAFAVTVEPRGGKSSPTLETMQVLGNVVKG